MAVPEAYGGSSSALFETALVLEEIAKGCCHRHGRAGRGRL
jgi:alkylation response protein AidB-like acyl-CoA dehydrogenase